MKKKLQVIALGLAVIGISLTAAKPANAQNPLATIVDRIAEKFNLNKNDVQKTVDDFRSEKQKLREDQRKTNLEEKLAQAVKDGKITESQKQAILRKTDELRKERESRHTEMLNWMKQNGLEGKFGFGMGVGKFGPGRVMHPWK